jgi:hypothetical protein
VTTSRSLGSDVRVRWKREDRLNPERTDQDIKHILELLIQVRALWERAVDGGSWMPRGDTNGRGKGFQDLRPTESAAHSPMQQNLRAKARQAAGLIYHARADLQEALSVLDGGEFGTDPEEWIQAAEKRSAATQRRG